MKIIFIISFVCLLIGLIIPYIIEYLLNKFCRKMVVMSKDNQSLWAEVPG